MLKPIEMNGFNILYTYQPSPEEKRDIADMINNCPRTFHRWDDCFTGAELDVIHFPDGEKHSKAWDELSYYFFPEQRP